MFLSSIDIQAFRNITSTSLCFSNRFNIFYGGNGSGKTSLLEAIYHLSLARSFKTRSFAHVIQNNQSELTLFGRFGDLSAGLSRSRGGKLRIRIAEKDIQSPAELAKIFPIQLINPDTYLLITDGPILRRQFIDWGVFHVEHEFLSQWKQLQRVIKQRNAALKQGDYSLSENNFLSWNKDLILLSNSITASREQYINRFRPVFNDFLSRLLDFDNISIEFYRGWPVEKDLESVLSQSIRRDQFLGYTYYGAHRADLIIKIGNKLAQDVMSRGQLKLLVCAMQLAQVFLLERETGRKTVFLIDDLPSELDEKHLRALCDLLIELETQVFMTGIDRDPFKAVLKLRGSQLFSVENGFISQKDIISLEEEILI